MEQLEVIFTYNVQTDLLSCVLPAARERVSDQAGIFPFSADDGISATALVLFLGYDEAADEVTGEFLGFEAPYFRKMYSHTRSVVKSRIRDAVPFEITESGLNIDFDAVDLSVIDPDIKRDQKTAVFFAMLVTLLDDLFFQTGEFIAEHDRRRAAVVQFGPPESETRRRPISEPGVRGEVVCC